MVSNHSTSRTSSSHIEQSQSIPYAATRRLMRELKELRTSPPEGIRVQLSEESVLDVVGIVEGPGESPLEKRSTGNRPAFTRLRRGHAISRRILSREI